MKAFHPFHLVTPSPWPFLAALSSLFVTVGGVMYMHNIEQGGFLLSFGLISLTFIATLWWRDVVREATFEGRHTLAVQKGLRLGMILFIVSEVMFFFSFFWAFFHSALSPAIELGSVWPPNGVSAFSPWGVPFLNTVILLYSGVTITLAHHALIQGNAALVHEGFAFTIFLAIFFTFLQLIEYSQATFSIADSVFGSCFFMATGFHGLHVIIGTTFIAVCFLRFHLGHFTTSHHLGFEAAAWYWHFVDVVWLFLFISIYWWGSAGAY